MKIELRKSNHALFPIKKKSLKKKNTVLELSTSMNDGINILYAWGTKAFLHCSCCQS